MLSSAFLFVGVAGAGGSKPSSSALKLRLSARTKFWGSQYVRRQLD